MGGEKDRGKESKVEVEVKVEKSPARNGRAYLTIGCYKKLIY